MWEVCLPSPEYAKENLWELVLFCYHVGPRLLKSVGQAWYQVLFPGSLLKNMYIF